MAAAAEHSTPNQLGRWIWLRPADLTLFPKTIERLRLSHGLLTPQQFIERLRAGEMEIVFLSNCCFVLVAWSECEHGRTLSMLTVDAPMKDAAVGLEIFENAARERGAREIISVGHRAWTKVLQQAGYTIAPAILIRKVLQ